MLKKILSRFNLRLLLIHFTAALFLATAFNRFSYLRDINYIQDLRVNTKPIQEFIEIKGADATVWFVITPMIANTAGILAAFLISLFLCLRNRWSWLNAALLLILLMLLVNRLNLPGYIAYSTSFLNRLSNTCLLFIASGSILALISLLLFFQGRSSALSTADRTHRLQQSRPSVRDRYNQDQFAPTAR
jgi:hypothetical protein